MGIEDVLDKLLEKIKAHRESIPGYEIEKEMAPDATYYDGIRAGLAWVEQLLSDKINEERGITRPQES